jgi:hypothetical protein
MIEKTGGQLHRGMPGRILPVAPRPAPGLARVASGRVPRFSSPWTRVYRQLPENEQQGCRADHAHPGPAKKRKSTPKPDSFNPAADHDISSPYLASARKLPRSANFSPPRRPIDKKDAGTRALVYLSVAF